MKKLNKSPENLLENLIFLDLKSVDLQKEYSSWNRVLFNGELPPIKITLSRMKTASGLTSFKRSTGEITVKISNLLKITKVEFSKVLVHEMIHVWFFSKGMNVGHGPEFKAKARELSPKAGFDIPLEHDISKNQVDNKVAKSKVYDFVIFTNPNGSHSIALFNKDKFSRQEFIDEYSSGFMGGVSFMIGTGETLLGNKFKINRKLKRPSFFGIDEDQVKELKSKATIHKTIKH